MLQRASLLKITFTIFNTIIHTSYRISQRNYQKKEKLLPLSWKCNHFVWKPAWCICQSACLSTIENTLLHIILHNCLALCYKGLSFNQRPTWTSLVFFWFLHYCENYWRVSLWLYHLSMGFPRQEYWSGLPFSSPGYLPNPEIKPKSPTLAGECKRHSFSTWVRKIPGNWMATHSSTLAWEIPWTEEPGGLQSRGSQRVRHILVTKQQQQQLRLAMYL